MQSLDESITSHENRNKFSLDFKFSARKIISMPSFLRAPAQPKYSCGPKSVNKWQSHALPHKSIDVNNSMHHRPQGSIDVSDPMHH
uniref:Uncharacterized protein n=1 Tax=Romanomermis culicivorax TaxID=13658 RepID=A0A915K6E3_ROMCU